MRDFGADGAFGALLGLELCSMCALFGRESGVLRAAGERSRRDKYRDDGAQSDARDYRADP